MGHIATNRPRALLKRAAATAALALGLAAPTTADPAELIFDIFIPPQAPIVSEGMVPWAKQVEEASNGALTITIPTAPMAPVPRIFDALQDGVFDITVAPLVIREKDFALAKVFNIPMVAEGTSGQASAAFWQVYENHFEAANEFKDFVPLALFALGGNHFMTVDAPITTIDDFANVKIRADGKEALDMLDALGAVPVGGPGVAMFEMMSSNVVDGTMAQPGPASQLGLAGLVEHVTTLPGGLFRPTFCICMNIDTFEGLSDAAKAAIMDHSGEMLSVALGTLSQAEDDFGTEVMTDKGAVFTPASDALITDIVARTAFITEDWLAIAAERGIDGPAALAELRAVAVE